MRVLGRQSLTNFRVDNSQSKHLLLSSLVARKLSHYPNSLFGNFVASSKCLIVRIFTMAKIWKYSKYPTNRYTLKNNANVCRKHVKFAKVLQKVLKCARFL